MPPEIHSPRHVLDIVRGHNLLHYIEISLMPDLGKVALDNALVPRLKG